MASWDESPVHSAHLAQAIRAIDMAQMQLKTEAPEPMRSDTPSLTAVVVTSMLAGSVWTLLISALIRGGW